jgi:16S rRNA (adenine1518-N6/adenine1519-N6)-dimethyltransferase
VTSAVIHLRTREEKPWDILDEAVFFRTVRASFAMRRKKLQNGLAAGFSELGKQGAGEMIAACGFDENVRGETLSIDDFARLSNAIVEWRNR